MAVNNNGNLLDTAGEVAIDFVWGNMPMQPNDARPDALANRLDPAKNDHIIALSGWNGFPQYNPNTTGEDVAGATDYVLVPDVRGFTTASAQDAMKDASLTVTTASAATNAAVAITAVARTSGQTTTTITVSGGTTAFPVGSKVVVAGINDGANSLTANGTWTVTGGSGSTITVTTVSTLSISISAPLTGTPTVVGLAGTIKTQSLTPGQNNVVPGAAVTLTPYATAS